MREDQRSNATFSLLHLHRKSSIIIRLGCFWGIKDIPNVDSNTGSEKNAAEKGVVIPPGTSLIVC